MNRFLYIVCVNILLVFFWGCKSNRLKVDISEIKEEAEIVRFEKELFTLSKDTLQSITNLSNKYPKYFDLFTYKVIQIGGLGDEYFLEAFKMFVVDTMIQNVNNMVEKEFSDFDQTEEQLVLAFKRYKYHFPDKEIPTIYTYVSGFNQSVVTAENIIGIGLDKYLGRDCDYYKLLSSTPRYKVLNMHKEKIVSDVAYAWGITEFEHTNKATTVLDNMIHKGKLMYFVDALLPEMHDSLKIGYTAKQLDWCERNEAQMWSQLIEFKMLYSNNRMDIVRYTNDGPRTSGFPVESPGRTGVWIGWQIVKEYMEKFPETSLVELMNNSDYQQILNDSKYFPE